MVSCGGDNSGGGGSSSDSGSDSDAANAINDAIGAFESVGELADAFNKAGIATDYCSSTGSPIDVDGDDLSNDDADYGGQRGFCTATHNALSPDTPAGALYIAGGISCFAGREGLFDDLSSGDSNEETIDIKINTKCWGSSDQVDAMQDDMGVNKIEDVEVTVTKQSSSHPYDYKVEVELEGSLDITTYIKVSSKKIAVMTSEESSTWAFNFNTDTGKLLYESIDADNYRRMRVLIEGEVNSSNEFTEVSNLEGFHLEAGSGGVSELSTFIGNIADGILGNVYIDSASDEEDNCYKPGGGEDCSAFTAISSSDSEATALYSSIGSAATALAGASELLSFSTADPSVTDITD